MAATREPLAELQQTAVYETPVKTVALTPVAPLRRLQSVGLASVGPHSACKSPAEEAALLRTVSSVMKLHMDSVQRAASLGSEEEYSSAKAAAAADLATLQKQLTGGEVEPGCEGVVARRYWPENSILRRDVAVFFSELSDLVSSELSELVALPDATTLKTSLFSWASDTMTSTTSSISRALEAAAPVIVLAKTVVSDAALAEAQAQLAAAATPVETAVSEAAVLEPMAEERVIPMESAAEPTEPVVEEVTPAAAEAELPVAVPVATHRNGIACFLRRLLLLSALGAGAAVAAHHRQAIAGEVNKRVAQLRAMRPKANAMPAEAPADATPAPAEEAAAAAPVEAPAQPVAAPGAAL